jgi:ABC-2 type transport system ATP-binding protein
MIAAAGLTRQFGSRVVVDNVSFEVAPSEIVALLGPNGAGKTTTMRMLAGLIAPSAGQVFIDKTVLERATAGVLRPLIGFLTETPGLWDRLTVRENLAVYARLYGVREPDRAIDTVLDLFELRDASNARAAELSKGMRQKVALGRALLHDPRVLLLDEPTSGLDPEIRRSVRHLLDERRAAGCAILVSTHNLDEAERIADRVAVLHGRLIAIDRPEALRQRLTTGRLLVRFASGAAAFAGTILRIDPNAVLDDDVCHMSVADVRRDAPAIVSALVAAGAQIVEVRPEIPALEDVYLSLMDDAS